MGQVRNEFLQYRPLKGMLGMKKIDDLKSQIEQANKLLDAIEHFERKASGKIEDAQSYAYWFPELKEKYIRTASVCKAASMRLRKKLQYLLIEIVVE